MDTSITEYPQFFTATNLEWKKLLKPDKYKDIVISSLRFFRPCWCSQKAPRRRCVLCAGKVAGQRHQRQEV